MMELTWIQELGLAFIGGFAIGCAVGIGGAIILFFIVGLIRLLSWLRKH